MALSEQNIDTLIDEARAAAKKSRDSVRPQIAAKYKELTALPKKERLAETARRIEAVQAYAEREKAARSEEGAKAVREGLRDVLEARFGEVSEDDLDRVILKVRHAIESDAHADAREVLHEGQGHPPKKHSTRTRIGI